MKNCERYKSVILGVDEQIMALKIVVLRTCGDSVSLTFLAVMQGSLIFLRCCGVQNPHVPLFKFSRRQDV